MLYKLRFALSFIDQGLNFRSFSRFSEKQILKYKSKKLNNMVRYAAKNSEFYKELYKDIDLSKDINITSLPFLEKRNLVESFDGLITVKDISRKKLKEYFKEPFDFSSRFENKYLAFHTSGSTGNPAYIVWGEDVFGISTANYFFRIASAIKLDVNVLRAFLKRVRVAYIGITDDYIGGNSWAYEMKSFAKLKMLSVFLPMNEIIEELNSFRPDVLMTKPSLLGELSRKQREGKLKINLRNVIFAGEMISPSDSLDIERNFGVKPLNSYSACETGPIAFQINENIEGLNVFEDLVWLELVDDDGKPINNYYESGNIVITNLYNKYMPIIRYRIGDKAYFIPDEKPGNLSKISYIQGRGTSYFVFKNELENSIKVSEFPFWSLYIPGILRYQVFQTDKNSLKVNIEFEEQLKEDEKKLIMEGLKKKIRRIISSHNLACEINIEIEEVAKILPNSAGKIQITFPMK